MNVFKKFWNSFKNIFGISHNSKYVKDYLDESNMRYSIYMSIVIIILEFYLIIRQTNKYVLTDAYLPVGEATTEYVKSLSFPARFFYYNSYYWLLISLGCSMLFYALFYLSKKKHTKTFFIITNVFAGLLLVLTFLIPLEVVIKKFNFSSYKAATSAVLLIIFYVSLLLFALAVIGSSIYRFLGHRKRILSYVLVISFFGLSCLVFGTMVSFSDFTSSARPKMLICFLMMAIYIGCLLIWKPYISLGLLGSFFLAVYLLVINVERFGGRHFEEGDGINYLTFFISLLMITIAMYNQRVKEAGKDEELEVLATKDTLTGLYSFDYFVNLTKRKIHDENLKTNEWVYLFLDITSFKIFNDQRGFEEGNKFLREVGQVISGVFKNQLISRQSDDHYVAFVPNNNIEEKLDIINEEVEKLDLDIRPGVKVGKYILRDLNEDPHQAIEKARYACAVLEKHVGYSSLYYDAKMHDNYRLIQHIVRHVDEAIENGDLSVKYQPIVLSKNNELCGVEALARWHSAKYGDFSPGLFIAALENAQLIYKVDLAILRKVCADLRYNLANDYPPIPASINVSRLDFAIVDIVSMIDEIVQEYEVPRELISIELTESALLDDNKVLKTAIDEFHKLGYKVWLDDFGAGYSSLNVLNDYDFDLIKLDMKFLSDFEHNKKSKALINSVVKMAKEIEVDTLCEGVETDEEARFLKQIGCEKLQGYFFGKPSTYEEMKDKIINGHFKLSKEIKKQEQ